MKINIPAGEILAIGIIIVFIGASIASGMSGSINTGAMDFEDSIEADEIKELTDEKIISVERDTIKNYALDLQRSTTLYVGGDGANNYTYIQDAIDDANTGDTVFVYSGTYYEHLVIDKTINLIGEDKNETIIDGSDTGNVVYIDANNVSINNFLIRNSGTDYDECGIQIGYGNNLEIKNNVITDTYAAIRGFPKFSMFADNEVSRFDEYGFWFIYAENNSIINNEINNGEGDGYNIFLIYSSDNNSVVGNILSDNPGGWGVKITSSSGNIVINNTIVNNYGGVYIKGSPENHVYHNYFVNNNQNACDNCCSTWDNGYPSGGNYWDDYEGSDNFSGPDQNVPGSDGIGDVPYEISCGAMKDEYPLMVPSTGENHDIEVVFLDVPYYAPLNEITYVQASIRNLGFYDESDILVNFLVNETVENSMILSSLNSWQLEHVSFEWIPTNEGVYTVGVEAEPVPGENITSNNILNTIVQAIPVSDIWVSPELFDLHLNNEAILTYNLTIGNEETATATLEFNVTVSSVPWLTVYPLEGVLDIGSSLDLAITVNTTALLEYAYTALIIMSSNDFNEPTLIIPVIVSVDDFEILWKNSENVEVSYYTSIFSSFINDDDIADILVNQSVLNGSNGELIWNTEIGKICGVGDINNDGKDEVFTKVENPSAYPGNYSTLYCLNRSNGEIIWDCNIECTIINNIVVGDLLGDERKEIIVATGDWVYRDNQYVYCINGSTGDFIWMKRTINRPICAAIADVNADGNNNVLVSSWEQRLYCLNGENNDSIWEINTIVDDRTLCIGDLNDDPYKEIIIEAGYGVRCVSGKNGTFLWEWEQDWDAGVKGSFQSILIADMIPNIPGNEVIAGSTCGIYCLYGGDIAPSGGREIWHAGRANGILPNIVMSAAIGDLNHDGQLDVVAITDDCPPWTKGNVYALYGQYGSPLWTYENCGTSDFQAILTTDLTGDSYPEVIAKDNSYVCALLDNFPLDNYPPNKPTIVGPTTGYINANYLFTACTTDSDGEGVYYYFDWGDGSGNISGKRLSDVLISMSHSWKKQGVYTVKVKALDEHGAESNWSEFLSVNISVICGDLNSDGTLNIADLTYIIAYLYGSGPPPEPDLCIGDVNGDGSVNIGDLTYIIAYLYGGGLPPVENCCD